MRKGISTGGTKFAANQPSPSVRKKLRGKTKMLLAIVITVLVTGFLTILFLNLRAGEKQIRYELPHRFAVRDPQFLRCMGQLLGPGIPIGNRVKALQNGDEIFPAMLGAIRGARETITFETYIYWTGEIGRKFSEALCERARAGVKVHVMLDWVGSGKMEGKFLEEMKAAGVEVLGTKIVAGEVVVDRCQRTIVKGVYAAGCVTSANCQMIIAAGQGATAAQSINRDLFKQSLATHSLRRFRSRQLRNRRQVRARI